MWLDYFISKQSKPVSVDFPYSEDYGYMLLYLVFFLNGVQDPNSTLHVDVARTSQIVPKLSKSFTSNFFLH